MLDLSRDEKAKHRLPRWFSEAPTRLRHSDEPLHLLERIVDLSVEEDLLRREVPAVHCLEDRVEALLVAGLVGDLAALDDIDAAQKRRDRDQRLSHRDEDFHQPNAGLYGHVAFQNAGQHGNALLCKDIRSLLSSAAFFTRGL